SGIGNQGLASYNSGVCTGTGSSSDNNSFYVTNLSDVHWSWLPNSAYSPASWGSYKSSTGQDANSTLTVGNASVAGSTLIGCTVSGWPAANNPVPESPFGGPSRHNERDPSRRLRSRRTGCRVQHHQRWKHGRSLLSRRRH